MKKTNYDIIDIICGIAIVLVGIYLTFGIVVAIMGGIQAISGKVPTIDKTCCCYCETKNE